MLLSPESSNYMSSTVYQQGNTLSPACGENLGKYILGFKGCLYEARHFNKMRRLT